MRYRDILTERAATARGYSKFIGKAGTVFYIGHNVEEGTMVQGRAYVAGTTPFEPARKKIGHASCVMTDREHDAERNNVRVYSSASFVEPEYRRYGVLGAIYDHLGQYGFVVYPATGEVGHKNLQAQSDDAKAFWAARERRASETKLIPVSEAEFFGWHSPFAIADQVAGHPVLEKLELSGNQYPMLVLWQRQYPTGPQRVGVMFDSERGYRLTVMLTHPKVGTMHDFPYIRDGGSIRLYYANLERAMRPGTAKAIREVDKLLTAAKSG